MYEVIFWFMTSCNGRIILRKYPPRGKTILFKIRAQWARTLIINYSTAKTTRFSLHRLNISPHKGNIRFAVL